MSHEDYLRPHPPMRSRRASRWGAYYNVMARWFREMAHGLNDYPASQQYAQDEAARYQAGADMIAAGQHPAQVDGRWK